jgi:circadian clock protein KaiC
MWSRLKGTTTGVTGLDLVLDDGLEPGAMLVVAGAPGTGKTILAQQMCFANGTADRKCIYYTTVSEPHSKLVRHLEQFSFYDPEALGTRVEHIHLGDFLQPARQEGLGPLVSEIVRKTLEEEPSIVVLDSARMLRDFADEPELRRALYDLTGRIAQTGTVLLLVGEYAPEELRSGIEFSMADGIIQLENESREPVDRRWLRIAKMRGRSYRSGKHTFQIGPGGVQVFPRIETLIPHLVTAVSEQVPSGIPGLDALMGGGAKQGDATLVNGPSGVGKTIFGLRWLTQGLERGERCLYVTFQDTADQLVRGAAVFGWDLSAARVATNISISYVPMDDLDLDVLATAVRSELSEHATSRIVIDSLSELAFAAREAERFPAYMRSLVGLVRAAGSSLLITSETALFGVAANAMDGLLFLFDNVIDLRFIEDGARIGRSVHVAKMRNSQHEMTLNGITITDRGLMVGDKLESVAGLLGASAQRTDGPQVSVRSVAKGSAARRVLRAEGEVEGGAAVDGALGPGAPAVAFDDPLDADQADAGAVAGAEAGATAAAIAGGGAGAGGAGAGKFAGAVEALEGLEQLVRVGGIEADPVVADTAADRGLILGGGGELDDGVVAPDGELPGVLDQVVENGADENTIRGGPDAVLDGEADPAAGITGSQAVGDRADLRAEIDRHQVQVGARYL